MMELESIELAHAVIDDRFAALTLATKAMPGDEECSVRVKHVLDTFVKEHVDVEDVILVRHDGEHSGFDLFVTFLKERVGEVEAALTRYKGERLEHASVEAGVRLINISGSGFARSNEFLEEIYSAISDSGINIMAQMCSDVGIMIFCGISEDDRAIAVAMNKLKIQFEWR